MGRVYYGEDDPRPDADRWAPAMREWLYRYARHAYAAEDIATMCDEETVEAYLHYAE